MPICAEQSAWNICLHDISYDILSPPCFQLFFRIIVSKRDHDWAAETSHSSKYSSLFPENVKDYKIVCYYTNWSQGRKLAGRFLPEDIDPWLCTHVFFAFAKISGGTIAPTLWLDEAGRPLHGWWLKFLTCIINILIWNISNTYLTCGSQFWMFITNFRFICES